MDKKKYITFISGLDPETHAWLVQRSNILGLKIGDFVAVALKRARYDDIYGDLETEMQSQNAMIALGGIELSADLERQKRERVFALAYQYQDTPNENLADLLKLACDVAGMDYQEVMTYAENDPFGSIISSSDTSTQIERCIQWLYHTLTGYKGFVKVEDNPVYAKNDLEEMSIERGWSSKTLSRAKTRINTQLRQKAGEEFPYKEVKTIRIGNRWYWYYDDRSVEIIEKLFERGASVKGELTERRKMFSEEGGIMSEVLTTKEQNEPATEQRLPKRCATRTADGDGNCYLTC